MIFFLRLPCTYRLGGSKSLELSGGTNLTLGTGDQDMTVVLHLDGELVLSGESSIQLKPRTKMVMYINGDATFSGGSSTRPEDAQIYVYGKRKVTLSGGSGASLFLFAPDSAVTFSGGSNISGAVWARSWKGSGSSFLIEKNVDPSQLKVMLPNSQRFESIQSWQRQAVN
ncbi:hypothetical protein GS597_16080 [Synechococcales cyanobacterium C]|uniref:DUF7305 domain-containing protein n=1 Tax=Petrachloros mirabilis ULC683 TaxID=2781853 RepID=A0A8K2A1W4_9CYAN|nr:collagen-binding domain-containing protein [Petrachloros mirabilis]NCJ07997.1 hypothetical protein [Petrachloros mirabilis ULC683]